MGSDRMFGFGISLYDRRIRRKNLGLQTKCGFEINKEIKGNEAKNDGFDMKFEFGMCIYNGEEKSWVSDEVWI